MTQKEAQLLILNDIVGFYNLGNRASVSTEAGALCVYLTSDGKSCAAGRWMKKPPLNSTAPLERELFDKMKPEAILAGLTFMQRLQGLHDNPSNWSETGLSSRGQEYVGYIKRSFDL